MLVFSGYPIKIDENRAEIMGCDYLLMKKKNNQIQIPNVEKGYIKREADRMLASATERIVILNAGTGYGKTQILACFVSQCREKSAWYSLSGTDNELISFVRNFTKSVLHALGREEEEFHISAFGPEDLDLLVEQLVLWLDERVSELNLILDDFQEIHNPDIHNLLNVLIETMGEKLRFFIAGMRSLPDFAEEYIKEQRAVCIGAEELKFGPLEIQRLLELTVVGALPESAPELIHFYTEGWPVGVVLVIQQMRQQRKEITPEGIKEICEKLEVSEYFMARVYKMLPYEIQTFLERTSVLDYMTVPACNAVLGNYQSESLLKYLVREKLFVQSLGEQSGIYRYHSIFQRFLLSLISKTERQEALKRAAYFFLKTEDKVQAAEYGCQSGSTEVVQAVLEAAGEEILQEGFYETLMRWFAFLQSKDCSLTSKSRFLYGKYLWAVGQKQQAKKELLKAGEACRREGQEKGYQNVLLFLAKAARKDGNLKCFLEYLEQAEEILPENLRERVRAGNFGEGDLPGQKRQGISKSHPEQGRLQISWSPPEQKPRQDALLGHWADQAAAVCTERLKHECGASRMKTVRQWLFSWKSFGIPFAAGSFLWYAEHMFCKESGEEPDAGGLEDGFLLQDCLLTEQFFAAYQREDDPEVSSLALQIIQNAEYETLHTAVAWKMLAILSWNKKNYRKAMEQSRVGDHFFYRNQMQGTMFEKKHQHILEEINALHQNVQKPRLLSPSKQEPGQKEGGKIRIQCMKRFCVRLSNGEEVRWRTKKARELFAYLFHLQGEGVEREDFITLLWPETGVKSATALFHTTLYSIRQVFVQAGLDHLIVYEKKRYSLHMQMVSSDLEELQTFFWEFSEKKRPPEDVISLYEGGYMENMGYLWAYGTAKKLEDACLRICQKGAAARMEENREDLAIPFLRCMQEIEPYDEKVVTLLIVCLYRSGKQGEAKRQYDRMVKLYKEDLELEFEKTFQELVQDSEYGGPGR